MKGKVAVFTRQPASSRCLLKLLENVERLADHLQPGTVTTLHVYHDKECALIPGTRPCDSKPTMQVKREDEW